jgi:putative Ca2+/H+ antiporter (TMEM165/GDT1 family)
LLTAFGVSFGIVLAAEIGDKSQLVALAFSSVYRWWQVLLGITVATLVVHLGSVALGKVAEDNLPETAVGIAAGLAFIAFAVWTVRGDTLSGDETGRRVGLGPIAVVTVAFFLAELGDKTMLATVTLATQYDSFVGTWFGSTLGMVAADALAIGVGVLAGKRLPQKQIRYFAAALFVVFGVVLIVQAVV